MSAYMVDRRRMCKCGLIARYEVFNTMNASMGYYCKRCGLQLIRKLDAQAS